MIEAIAYKKPVDNPKKAAGSIISELGLNIIITPKNPTKTAIQLLNPTFSPKDVTDRIVIKIGAEKNKLTVSAIGSAARDK
jgi:hypothetical protein